MKTQTFLDPNSSFSTRSQPRRYHFALLHSNQTSLVAQTVKRLFTMWETRVRSLSREDLLEKEMAIHSSTTAWKIPWTEEPGRLQSMGSQRVRQDRLSDFTFTFTHTHIYIYSHIIILTDIFSEEIE